jgi:hypothetical protein
MRLAIAILACMLSGLTFAGYDLHITRKLHWADENGPRISISEWRNYVESDTQVIQDKENDQFSFVISLESERFPLLYDPRLDELFTKDPSAKAIQKLRSIAKVLHAYVQGDDGEFYPPRP